MEIQPQTSSRSVSVWQLIAITSIFLLILFIWLSNLGLRENTPIIYWQKFSSYFIYLKFLAFVIALVALWFSSKPKAREWMTFLVIILGSCIISGFVHWVSLFSAKYVNHVGTVEFKEKVYQLATVEKYDYDTYYYLGECDYNAYACEFHKIYGTFSIFEPKIGLTEDAQKLVVKLNGKTIYDFDGVKSNCNDNYGYCNNIP